MLGAESVDGVEGDVEVGLGALGGGDVDGEHRGGGVGCGEEGVVGVDDQLELVALGQDVVGGLEGKVAVVAWPAWSAVKV